jgi:hypothetical protein
VSDSLAAATQKVLPSNFVLTFRYPLLCIVFMQLLIRSLIREPTASQLELIVHIWLQNTESERIWNLPGRSGGTATGSAGRLILIEDKRMVGIAGVVWKKPLLPMLDHW